MSSQFEIMTGEIDFHFEEYDSLNFEPLATARDWFTEANTLKVREPRAMCLSTVNADFQITTRVMAVLDFVEEGLIFATHSCSRKIRDISVIPQACAHFYWRELGRQLSLSGEATRLDHVHAQARWSERPIPLHSMSGASRQSEVLGEPSELLRRAQALEAEGELQCPDRFNVYLLKPDLIEFWSASSNRLHKRVKCERLEGAWQCQRLQP